MQFQARKWFAAGTAAVMLLSGMAFFPATGSAEGTMAAEDITENMSIGWNIGNSLDSTGYGETSWGNPKVTQELIDMRQIGFILLGSLAKGDSPQCGEMSRSDKGDGRQLGAVTK